MNIRRPLAFLTLLALTCAACGRDATSSTVSVTAEPIPPSVAAASPSPTSQTPTSPPAASTPAPAPTPSSPAPVPTTPPATPSPSASTDLPGEAIDFGPRAGTVLAVIGVGHDDHLNLRAGPGTDQQVVARLAPTQDDVVAQGATRTLPAFWYQVEVDGTVGWAAARFLAQLGAVEDATARILADLGSMPSAGSMEELGRVVAESQAQGTEPGTTVTMVVAPSEMDGADSVTFDVVGLADDAVRGLRLRVVGTPADVGFTLASVEQTLLCDRGVDDGLCV